MVNQAGLRESSGRLFNNNAESAYTLPADAEEAQRLNEQHARLTFAIGRLILPELHLGAGDRVLDAATGTGIWLLDCLSQSPKEVSFTGIDISPHLFPSLDRTPANATFIEHSLLSLPEAWTSTYTLINQRLLIAALRVDEWPRALQEYRRILRPGGWVQLCEVYPGLSPGSWMNDALARKRGTDVNCALHLEGWLHDAGFVNIQTAVRGLPLGATGTDTHNYTKLRLDLYKGMKDAAVSVGVVSSAEEYDDFLSDLQAELEATNTYLQHYWVWAQKPAESLLQEPGNGALTRAVLHM